MSKPSTCPGNRDRYTAPSCAAICRSCNYSRLRSGGRAHQRRLRSCGVFRPCGQRHGLPVGWAELREERPAPPPDVRRGPSVVAL